MKKISLSISTVIIFLITSCSKDEIIEPVTPANPNIFGVLVNQSEGQQLSTNQKIDLLKNQFKVPYTRHQQVLTNFNGSIPTYDSYVNNGLKVLLNVTSKVTSFTDSAGPYITDTVLYRQKITGLLNIYKPEVLVIENEEANSSYYTGTAQEYINLLNIAIDETKKRNIKVTNGGFTARMSKLLVWDYYTSTGQTTKATEYAQKVFPDTLLNTVGVAGYIATNASVSTTFNKAKLLLNEYKLNKMTYLNIHWYEPAKEGDYPTANIDNIANSDMKGFKETVEVLKQICNKPVITNEIGQFNTKGTLTTDILQKCYDLNLPYVIWYSGDGPKIGDAKALYNGSGILRESGTAFKNFIITKY